MRVLGWKDWLEYGIGGLLCLVIVVLTVWQCILINANPATLSTRDFSSDIAVQQAQISTQQMATQLLLFK